MSSNRYLIGLLLVVIAFCWGIDQGLRADVAKDAAKATTTVSATPSALAGPAKAAPAKATPAKPAAATKPAAQGQKQMSGPAMKSKSADADAHHDDAEAAAGGGQSRKAKQAAAAAARATTPPSAPRNGRGQPWVSVPWPRPHPGTTPDYFGHVPRTGRKPAARAGRSRQSPLCTEALATPHPPSPSRTSWVPRHSHSYGNRGQWCHYRNHDTSAGTYHRSSCQHHGYDRLRDAIATARLSLTGGTASESSWTRFRTLGDCHAGYHHVPGQRLLRDRGE